MAGNGGQQKPSDSSAKGSKQQGGKGGGKRAAGRANALNRLVQQRAATMANLMVAARMRSIPKFRPDQQTLDTRGAMKSISFAPRGQGYYDAFVHQPEAAILSASVGPVTAIGGHAHLLIAGKPRVTASIRVPDPVSGTMSEQSSILTNATLILLNPTSSGSTVGVVARFADAAADPSKIGQITVENIDIPQFSDLGPVLPGHPHHPEHHLHDGKFDTNDPRVGRRVESIPLRLSVKFRNVTERFSMGGSVRVLRYNGSLQLNQDYGSISVPSPDDNPSAVGNQNPDGTPRDGGAFALHALMQTVRSAVRTKHFSGSELEHTHQSNSYPADFVRSLEFNDDVEFWQGVDCPAYSSVLILIDDFVSSGSMGGSNPGVNNSYEINVMCQRAARFEPGSLLHSKAKEHRCDTQHINKEGLKESTGPAATKATK